MDCLAFQRNSVAHDVNITGDITPIMEINQGTGAEVEWKFYSKVVRQVE